MEYSKAALSDIETLVTMRIDMLGENEILSDRQKLLIANNTKQYLKDGIADSSVISWIAVHHGMIVGMGCINFFSLPPNDWCPSGKTAYVGNMYVLPAFRKQGIASRILSHIVDEAKVCKCQRILLNTTDIGKPLYEKYGFVDSPTAMALYPFGVIPPA